MENYRDKETTVDKIVHILYAGYVCEYYIECIEECVKEFGKNEVMEAVKIFERKYKDSIKVIS